MDTMTNPAAAQADPRAVRNLAVLAAAAGFGGPLLHLLYRSLGDPQAANVVLGGALTMAALQWAPRAGIGMGLTRELFVGMLYLLKLWLALHFGGLGAPTVPWFLLCPAIAILLGGARPGLTWGAIVGATVLALFAIERGGARFAAYPVADPQLLQLASDLGLFALAIAVALLARQPTR